jgi:hypothetical protein
MYEQENYTTDATYATATFDDPILRRLLATAHHLVADCLLPSEIEMKFYAGLTAATPSASLFRACIGLNAPLQRDSASHLAAAVGRMLRGPSDRDWTRRYVLIHLHSQLMQAAHDAAEELRRDDIAVTPPNLRSALEFAAVYARPRSSLIPWDIANGTVEQMIEVVVKEYCVPRGREYFAVAAQ